MDTRGDDGLEGGVLLEELLTHTSRVSHDALCAHCASPAAAWSTCQLVHLRGDPASGAPAAVSAEIKRSRRAMQSSVCPHGWTVPLAHVLVSATLPCSLGFRCSCHCVSASCFAIRLRQHLQDSTFSWGWPSC